MIAVLTMIQKNVNRIESCLDTCRLNNQYNATQTKDNRSVLRHRRIFELELPVAEYNMTRLKNIYIPERPRMNADEYGFDTVKVVQMR